MSSSLFVAVGHRGLRMSSVDGIEWAHVQTGKEGEIYRAVAFGNGRFAAVGSYGGANIFASTADGIAWETGTKDARYVTYLRGVGFGKEAFLGLGGDPGSVGDSKPFVMTSDEGKVWSDPIPVIVTQSLAPLLPSRSRLHRMPSHSHPAGTCCAGLPMAMIVTSRSEIAVDGRCRRTQKIGRTSPTSRRSTR